MTTNISTDLEESTSNDNLPKYDDLVVDDDNIMDISGRNIKLIARAEKERTSMNWNLGVLVMLSTLFVPISSSVVYILYFSEMILSSNKDTSNLLFILTSTSCTILVLIIIFFINMYNLNKNISKMYKRLYIKEY